MAKKKTKVPAGDFPDMIFVQMGGYEDSFPVATTDLDELDSTKPVAVYERVRTGHVLRTTEIV